ncbi:general stress protein [Bacillus sp. JCM 19047]|uniref:Bacillithiol system redox-active protein YtxJ n=1 Tax=Shouchella miscanthi TaxID=2598861 RepID=A0ABU6NP04_9BACI|nr:bacillithiol system redox-active protein YtxJ [Shouchella miscanthi]MED4129927.1 bacillithiol system redox-active protein YtxJ [Shouchella miscanthi]GAF21336.1 general stress protein [Bacillus sp. JCM 19047]
MEELKSVQDWDKFQGKATEQTVLVFKHSTQCPISAEAFEEFQAFTSENPTFETAYVKVIESRPVSNQIAEDLNTTHKSPQLFVLKNGQVHWTESHWNIKNKAIAEQV